VILNNMGAAVMTMKHTAQIVAAVASLLCAPGLALAQDAMTAPAQKTVGDHTPKMVPSLAVLNSGGASLDARKLTMSDVGANSIVFADRPVRAAGHVLTAEFIKQWDEGNDSFAKDPPNATISVLNKDGTAIEDAVVVLKKPTLAGGNLTFEVDVLEGDLKGADGPASLFIDWFAARGGFARSRLAWRLVRSSLLRRRAGDRSCDRRSGRFGLSPLLSAALRILSIPAVLLDLG
jgi:hypothetical protein